MGQTVEHGSSDPLAPPSPRRLLECGRLVAMDPGLEEVCWRELENLGRGNTPHAGLSSPAESGDLQSLCAEH